MTRPSTVFWLAIAGSLAFSAFAQPTFESASPTAGGGTSERANQMADKGMYKNVDYRNAAKKGPMLVIIPGDVKSNNATFTQKFGPNNIADFAELELGRANFGILERNDLGPLLGEFQLAYTMGDPESARKMLQKGKFKTTKWVVKFDILKAEQVAQAQKGFDGQALGSLIGIFAGGRGGCGGSNRWRLGTDRRKHRRLGDRHAFQDSRRQHHRAGRHRLYGGERWKSAPHRSRCWAFPRGQRAVSRSIPWCSAWSRSWSGKSMQNTSNHRQGNPHDSSHRRAVCRRSARRLRFQSHATDRERTRRAVRWSPEL